MKYGPHVLISSESGTGKTHFAATVIQKRNPRPVLVQAFDASSKLTGYRKRADQIVLDKWDYGERELLYKDSVHVATIEHWHEKQGRGSAGMTMKGGGKVKTSTYTLQGQIFEGYLERMKHFADEATEWYAYIHDSTTFCEWAVRSYLSGVMKVQDNKMIWGQATDELERFYIALFPDLPITTIVLSHASTERVSGEATTARYEVRLPGRLAKDIIATFGEVYRGYVVPVKGEEPQYFMQTRTDGVWRCSSQLEVPNPLGPNPHWRDIYERAIQFLPEGETE